MRKIIITGSEGLIGREVSNFFENERCKVIRCDLTLDHNLSDETFVKQFFKENRADYLINLFALNDHIDKNKKGDNLFDISLSSFDNYLKINVVSLFSACREFAKNNLNGNIVNFSSTYGLISPLPDLYEGDNQKHIGYGVSKSAVVQLTKHLAVHLAPNIRVNCVAPGGVKFEQGEDFISNYSKHVPLGRMMNVSELNGLLDYLCSEQSSYMTGQTISIDGGWTSW